MNRRQVVSAMLLVPAALLSSAAGAQDAFPSKPLRIIVPFGPGGAPDAFARVVADKMASVLGQPLVVENRTGASSIIGTEVAVRSPADGYTLLVATPSTTILSASHRKLSFDPARDLQPVSMGVSMAPVLVTGANSALRDVQSVIAAAKAHPGKLVIASGGIGNSQHLAAEMFKQMAGVDMLHVPYQGTPAIVPALVSGEVDLTFADASSLPLIKAGKLRAIAVGSPTRSKTLPDVPTVAEAGLPGFNYQSWYGLMVPTGTPAPVIAQLNRAINRALADADVQSKLLSAGLVATPGTPDAMGAFLAEDARRWAKVIQAANIKFD